MNRPVAILCSGQGGQGREMFGWLAAEPKAAPVFATAARFLDGRDPRDLVREAEEAALFANRNGQILCVTQALAAWSVVAEHVPSAILAGYSVGEVAAWCCAGLFSVGQTLELVAERAALMDEAAPAHAGLAAIVGLERQVLEPLLREHGVHLAIVNALDSVVVGGADEAVSACLEAAERRGASRVVRLRVSVPSHTVLLRGAAEAFATRLAGETVQRPGDGRRLLSGIDAETVREPRSGLRKLAAQVGQTVQWQANLEACRELGAAAFLELGPGSSLSRMVEDPAARSIDQFRSAEGVGDWLRKSTAR